MRSLPDPEWSKKDEEFLKEHWGFEPTCWIAFYIKRSIDAIRKKAKRLNLPKPPCSLELWGRTADNFLKENYAELSNIELAKKLTIMFPFAKRSVKPGGVSSRLIILGLRRTKEQLARIKRRNVDNGSMKGKKPSRTKPIGTVRLNPSFYNYDGVRKPAYIIKTEQPNRWRLFKHYIWELHWGKIPAGYQVSCLNGDDLKFTIEDLILTRKKDSTTKAHAELSDKYVLSAFLHHREDKEEILDIYKKNPEALKGIIEQYRKVMLLNRTLHGKKKNK